MNFPTGHKSGHFKPAVDLLPVALETISPRKILHQRGKTDGLLNRWHDEEFEEIVYEQRKSYDAPSSFPISGEVGERLKPTVC